MPLVLFDLDNTLLDRVGAYARWAEGFCADHGLPAAAHDDLVALDGDGFRDRVELFTDVRRRYDLAPAVDDLVAAYHVDYPRQFVLDDAARAALRRVRAAGWKVGVVTNGPRSQERKLEVTGLLDEIDGLCVSGLVDSWKPDPDIFVEAARRCGSGLEGWMVGDSGPADVRGGQGVGLRTVWIHRGRTWDLGDPAPDARADDVPGAVDVILDV